MTYSEYLDSPKWKMLRAKKFLRNNSCELCGFREYLEIHHLNYDHVFGESLGDLMVVCGKHHQLIERLIATGAISRDGAPIDIKRSIFHAFGIGMPNDPKWRQTSQNKTKT